MPTIIGTYHARPVLYSHQRTVEIVDIETGDIVLYPDSRCYLVRTVKPPYSFFTYGDIYQGADVTAEVRAALDDIQREWDDVRPGGMEL